MIELIFQSTPLMRGETEDKIENTGLYIKFQSTPLIRGETLYVLHVRPSYYNFNPLPSCEGRPPLMDGRTSES